MSDTTRRILDAAEALFASEGYAATSHRRVASAAAVNLASIRYHFGSKRELFHAVLRGRLGPLDDERLRRLREIRRAGVLTIEGLVRALVEPMFELATNPDHGPRVLQLLGRARVEPGIHWKSASDLQVRVLREFGAAFRSCCPNLRPKTIRFLVSFFLGSISLALLDEPTLEILGASAGEPSSGLKDLRSWLERAFVDALYGASRTATVRGRRRRASHRI